jgi:hypothetical protein
MAALESLPELSSLPAQPLLREEQWRSQAFPASMLWEVFVCIQK